MNNRNRLPNISLSEIWLLGRARRAPPARPVAAKAWLGATLAALLLLCGAAGNAAAGGAGAGNANRAELHRLCTSRIAAAEKALTIPDQLLQAVAVVESGRWDPTRKRALPWPWTVYARGNGKKFDSKAEAIAEVERLRAAGVRNIDVGCMQVNLRHHPRAFDSLEQAFDPTFNVAYAGHFLKTLYRSKRSWSQAIASYHSSTPKYARPYRKKVVRAWNEARRAAAEIRRQERLSAFEERRARARKRRAEQARQREAKRLNTP